MMRKLQDMIIKIPCAGRVSTSFKFFWPRACAIIDAITLLVWPNTQINIEIKLPTIPTAPSEIVAFSGIFPTIIVSVIDKIGSAIPEINAGIASFCISEIFIDFVKLLIHNNKKDTRSGLENKFLPAEYTL